MCILGLFCIFLFAFFYSREYFNIRFDEKDKIGLDRGNVKLRPGTSFKY